MDNTAKHKERKDARINQVDAEAYTGQQARKDTESQQEYEDGSPLKGSFQGHNQVITESIGSQYNYFKEEEKLEFSNVTSFIKGARPSDESWERRGSDKDKLCYQQNLSKLFENRVLFISSAFHDYRWALVYNILLEEKLRVFKKHLLKFPDEKESRCIGFSKLVSLLEKEKDTLVVVDLNHLDKNQFHDAFYFSVTTQISDEYEEKLSNGGYIIILIDEDRARDIKNSSLLDYMHNFHIWEIFDKPISQEEVPEPSRFFNHLNRIQKTLLYTATFFRGISFRSFNDIVEYLLEDIGETEPVVVDIYTDVEHGDARKMKKVLKDNIVDIWRIHRDSFFNDCYLIGREAKGRYIVDFLYDELEDKLKTYFKEKQHFFWQSQFRTIEKNGLLFNPAINDELFKRIAFIVIESLKDDPEYYNDEWFRNMIYAIKNFEGQRFAVEGDTEEEKISNLFWEFVERNGLTEFFYRRLSLILLLMLQHDLNEHVDDYLNSLINFHHHDVLLRLIKKLSRNEKFDNLYWIKQLIERGNNDIKIAAYRWLVNSVAYWTPEKVWEAVKTWLPGEKKIAAYSPANHYASFFVVHFYVCEILQYPFSEFGKYGGKYSLFRGYDKTIKKSKDHIQFLFPQWLAEGTVYQFLGDNNQLPRVISLELFSLDWSVEPSVRKWLGMDAEVDKVSFRLGYEPSYFSLLADITETWFHILYGINSNGVPANRQLANHMIATLLKLRHLKPNDINRIINHWERKTGIYKTQLENLRMHISDLSDTTDKEEITIFRAFEGSLVSRKKNIEFLYEELNMQLSK